jgi:hypothetical protein
MDEESHDGSQGFRSGLDPGLAITGLGALGVAIFSGGIATFPLLLVAGLCAVGQMAISFFQVPTECDWPTPVEPLPETSSPSLAESNSPQQGRWVDRVNADRCRARAR